MANEQNTSEVKELKSVFLQSALEVLAKDGVDWTQMEGRADGIVSDTPKYFTSGQKSYRISGVKNPDGREGNMQISLSVIWRPAKADAVETPAPEFTPEQIAFLTTTAKASRDKSLLRRLEQIKAEQAGKTQE